MSSNKKYWKSVEELNPKSKIINALKEKEFTQEIPVDDFLSKEKTLKDSSHSRRDFLKYIGFSTAAATLAACEGPVKKTIPYVIQPEQLRPGVANYYATTIADGFDFSHVLVKTREGRPILIEKNKEALVKNSLNSRVIASILGLYDSERLQGPVSKDGQVLSWQDWKELDTKVVKKIEEAKANGKQVVLLTSTSASPTRDSLVKKLSDKFGGVNHVVYDSISEEAVLGAFYKKYGVRAMPDYDFSETETIVSFGADFLGDWQGGGFGDSYSKSRIPTSEGKMSHHVQFESNMTLSGANADKRHTLKPSEMKLALAVFYAYVSNSPLPKNHFSKKLSSAIKEASKTFLKAGDKAVLLTGISDENAQLLAFEINENAGSKAFDTQNYLLTRQGDLTAVRQLVKDMSSGQVDVLITDDVNPIYTMPNSEGFEKALTKVPFYLAFSQKIDETTSKATYIAASSHNLESWGDVELKRGHYGLIQPVIRPLFNTRQLEESLLAWIGIEDSYHNYLKSFWKENVLTDTSWDKALQNGTYQNKKNLDQVKSLPQDVQQLYTQLSKSVSSSKDFELVLYSKIGMGDGRQANNPWLQEFPDPITRTSWDNYITVSKADAKALGLKNSLVSSGALDGSYAQITVGDVSLKVPVIIQPGQALGTVGLALGYGRTEGVKEEMQVGINAFRVYNNFSQTQTVSINKLSGSMHEFACVQLQNTLAGRDDIVKETTLEIFSTKPKKVWNAPSEVSYDHNEIGVGSADLWDKFDDSVGHHFNLSIDLNACTGCGACVIACHAENNVPVVGKQEVRNFRDMHWLRIDRYYSSEEEFEGDYKKYEDAKGLVETAEMFKELRDPSANPQVVFQPIMCQHCNHAPCETVCPVAATSHGRQGQNQMAYNRCVGTRYCANNCPYKVRRFNWFLYNNNDEFDYYMNDDLGKMVINPDVVVRSRGVMEKCSFCIQKTQKTILDAKREGREIKDGEFQTACSNACTSGAMVFGDVNDKESTVVNLKKSDRMYHLLDHKGTRPNVFYHMKVRNI